MFFANVVYIPVALHDDFARAWEVAGDRLWERRSANKDLPDQPAPAQPGTQPQPAPAAATPFGRAWTWKFLSVEFLGDFLAELLSRVLLRRA
jgi:hypothetical protein